MSQTKTKQMSKVEEYYKEYKEKDGQITTLEDLMSFTESYYRSQLAKIPDIDNIREKCNEYEMDIIKAGGTKVDLSYHFEMGVN